QSAVTARTGTAWSFNGFSPALTNGTTYTVCATQSDGVGNTSTTASVTLTIDTTAPTVTIASPTASDELDGVNGFTISGTAEATPAVSVNVYVGSASCTGASTTLSASGASWSVNDSTDTSENT